MDPYAPPETNTRPAGDGEYAIVLPGVSQRVTVRGAGFFAGAQILIDGAPARRHGFLGKVKVPGDDGREVEARVLYALSGLAVVVNKQRFPVGPQNPAWLGLLVFAPLGLIGVGGLIGGILGGSGMFINRGIVSSSMSNGAKAISMIGVLLGALTIMLAVAATIQFAFGSD